MVRDYIELTRRECDAYCAAGGELRVFRNGKAYEVQKGYGFKACYMSEGSPLVRIAEARREDDSKRFDVCINESLLHPEERPFSIVSFLRVRGRLTEAQLEAFTVLDKHCLADFLTIAGAIFTQKCLRREDGILVVDWQEVEAMEGKARDFWASMEKQPAAAPAELRRGEPAKAI